MKPFGNLILFVVIAAVVHFDATAQDVNPPDAAPLSFDEVEIKKILKHSPLEPAPPDATNSVAADPAAARLGQFLFFDARLSSNGQISCATCHDPVQGFTTSRSLAQGLGVGTRNALTLWNVAYNRWYYWDGRVDTLWAQALHPIERPLEMGGGRVQAAHLLQRDSQLRSAYESIFGAVGDFSDDRRFPPQAKPAPEDSRSQHHLLWSSMNESDRQMVDRVFSNLGKAIAAYERLLISKRAPFDVFVEGLRTGERQRLQAISPSAQRGLKLFIGRANCGLCHAGANFSDGEFHHIGVPSLNPELPPDAGRYLGAQKVIDDPFNARSIFSDDREGGAAQKLRYLSASPATWGQFKTPTLRNIARTAPYMHQGQFRTLWDVVGYYSTLEGAVQTAHHRETILIPLHLTEQEKQNMVAFLESLTDEGEDQTLLAAPQSPGTGL